MITSPTSPHPDLIRGTISWVTRNSEVSAHTQDNRHPQFPLTSPHPDLIRGTISWVTRNSEVSAHTQDNRHPQSRGQLLNPARMFRESPSRDRGEECATGLPQGVGSEAYLNSTSQGPTPEDARKGCLICGRSREFMKYPG
jgi:hypothetical protein